MNFLLISSTLVFCIIFFFLKQRAKDIEEKKERAYWDREREANFTRKRSLDGLDYITIPDEILHMDRASGTDLVSCYLRDLESLSSSKIVNLTGLTNTDLKLEYGTANINILSDYDLHYTKLVTILQKLAELLHEEHDDAHAVMVLEFAVSTGTDVSKSYYLLAQLYQDTGCAHKIEWLIEQAKGLRSMQKDTIVQTLQEACR